MLGRGHTNFNIQIIVVILKVTMRFFQQRPWIIGKIIMIVLGSHMPNSPEKWLYNRIYCPRNRSKQNKEIHTAYTAGTQYTRQSLNEKQHTWLHRETVIGCEAMYAVLHSNFAVYNVHIVCRRYKPCEFLWFVWTDCWGNKSYYIITSPVNMNYEVYCGSAAVKLTL